MTYFEVDNPGDWTRLVVAIVAFANIWLLSRQFIQNLAGWNAKTRDYQYAMMTWCLASFGAGVQGIGLNPPYTPVTVLLLVATLVTFRALKRDASWGEVAD